MSLDLSPADRAKFTAAKRAVDLVEDGMKLGLGTGSTAAFMVRCLGARLRARGWQVTAVATSTRTAEQARGEGIEVVSLNEAGRLDLTIDGTDEVDPAFNLIKGGGGAHLQEKIVASASDRMIVIADHGKVVPVLGAFPLPVEVIGFGWQSTAQAVAALLRDHDVDGTELRRRERDGTPFVSDEGNFILDLHLGRIGDPRALSAALNQVPGVVENGLFLNICNGVILGDARGRAEFRRPDGAAPEVSQVSFSED